MNDEKPILHIQAEHATVDEMKELRDLFDEMLTAYGRDDIVVVTDGQTDLQKMPAIESYVEDLAEMVAAELDDESQP